MKKTKKVLKWTKRKKNGQFKQKHDPFLLWGEYPHGWQIIKDIILCTMLLSALINQLQKLDVANLMATRTIIIEAEASEAKDEVKEQEEAKTGQFTAYSAGDGYTPGTTMASTKEVYEGAIACPIKYEFGTKIEVNGKTYTCEDRMAERFREGEYFDIYMNDIDQALAFGKKTLEYRVIK